MCPLFFSSFLYAKMVQDQQFLIRGKGGRNLEAHVGIYTIIAGNFQGRSAKFAVCIKNIFLRLSDRSVDNRR